MVTVSGIAAGGFVGAAVVWEALDPDPSNDWTNIEPSGTTDWIEVTPAAGSIWTPVAA